MITTPILFSWDGEAMHPANSTHAKLCDEQFIIGQRYRLVELNERSTASHNHYFAALATAWGNLPEHLIDIYPTPDHLRKFALIKCGYYNSSQIVVASEAEARRIATFMRPFDEFAVIRAACKVVTVYTAKSQKLAAMGRQEFQKSKQDVLDYVASLINTPTAQLTQNAGVNA